MPAAAAAPLPAAYLALFAVLLLCRPAPATPACLENAAEVLLGALGQLDAIAARRQRPDGEPSPADKNPHPIPPHLFPNSTDPETGRYQGFKASKWTSGYLAGMYFRAYMLTGDAKWAELGAAELPGLAQVAVETDSHKLSHLFDSSFGEALLAAAPGAPLDEYRHVMQTAAAALVQRYSPEVRAMQSWGNKDDGDFEVIMDSMASLKLLWEAAAMPGGKRAWADMALEHSRTVARDLFRPDGSTYHVALYDRDSGKRLLQRTHQGYADDSTWARGQAWALVGFTHAANLSGDSQLLATAHTAADYFLERLGEADDGVPLWDFDLPRNSKQAYKDSSAAAIAASGLLRLGALADEPRYTEAGVELLAALADGYLGWEGPQEQRVEALLREGSFNVPAGHYGTGLIWGDWYFLDALSQLLLAPGGPPGNRSACAP